MSKVFKVGDRLVGDGCPTFVIAEVGINHNGSVERAKEMITAAWEAGADAVKIQTFVTSEFLHPSHPTYQYDIDAQIDHDAEVEIWDYARSKDICLFSTPEDATSVEFLKTQKPPLIKIAAMDFNFPILVKQAASLGVPVILSSGMSDMEEVMRATRWVEEAGNPDYAVLHCVSCYPTPPEECNLNALQAMKAALDCPVGFSDHTIGTHIPLAAASLGASIIEKHFTLDKTLPGPDQISSMDAKDLARFVKELREMESAMGDGRKIPSPREAEPRKFKRRGIYAGAELEAGAKLSEENVAFWAPSTEESSVDDWPLFVGRRVKRAIAQGSVISIHDLD